MTTLSDDELIAELKKRFDHTKQALYDVKMITRKLEEVNKKLEASEQVKSNFVSHMKNEINNPLSSILGLSQQLISGIGNDPELVSSVARMIHSEAFGLDFQLRNIFAAAELESGETDLHVSIVEVDTLVRETVELFSHLMEDKSLSVSVNFDSLAEGVPLLFKTDSEKLQLVLANLISNAVEFNNEGGEVVISVMVADSALTISVKDSGIGISTDQIHRIFDRFHQLESGRRKSHKGHGLGLSITKAISDLMEGIVAVDCSGGQGCTFTVTIPEVQVDVEADAFSVDGNEFFFDDEKIESF
ncbi:MAG: HAMP domain-containing histidine kinase [Magnetococcales bacterium]|nr:HAMP domain-containing histidine kinase [Magnetococcales bacterium]MBF0156802.1 HAMP domain-containing histidine kinase [Magnetococcales bacterium]